MPILHTTEAKPLLAALRQLRDAALAENPPATQAVVATVGRLLDASVRLVPLASAVSLAPAAGAALLVVPLPDAPEPRTALVLNRTGTAFGHDEECIAHWAAALSALAMSRRQNERESESTRQQVNARRAVRRLSASERAAARKVLEQVGASEALVHLGQAARSAGVSPSVAVQALHKLRSAGLLRSESRGRHGTWVGVENPWVLTALREDAPW